LVNKNKKQQMKKLGFASALVLGGCVSDSEPPREAIARILATQPKVGIDCEFQSKTSILDEVSFIKAQSTATGLLVTKTLEHHKPLIYRFAAGRLESFTARNGVSRVIDNADESHEPTTVAEAHAVEVLELVKEHCF